MVVHIKNDKIKIKIGKIIAFSVDRNNGLTIVSAADSIQDRRTTFSPETTRETVRTNHPSLIVPMKTTDTGKSKKTTARADREGSSEKNTAISLPVTNPAPIILPTMVKAYAKVSFA